VTGERGLVSNRSRKRRRLLWGAGGLVLVAVLALAATRHSPVQIDPDKLATVERGDIARSVVATGKVEPKAKVEVKSKASGLVKKILADYGDPVKEGQVLVELDKEELRAQVREALASLHAAEAAFERTKVEAEGPDIPYLKSAQGRARKLFADGLIAPSVLDDAEKAYELALNKQVAARANVAVNQAEAEKARATLERAETDLRNSTIRSPMTGLVLARKVEVGDAVSSILVMGSQATLVMVLGDVSSVYVKGKVDEADIGKVYLDQPARITLESLKGKTFKGKVTRISPMGEEKDNVTTFEVRVSIDNPTGELKANMSANAEIILEKHENTLLVPESAVVYDKERKTFLELADPSAENGRRRIAVDLGIGNGVKHEVLRGVEEGQKVVLQ
jgi:HlyD family secretion protein